MKIMDKNAKYDYPEATASGFQLRTAASVPCFNWNHNMSFVCRAMRIHYPPVRYKRKRRRRKMHTKKSKNDLCMAAKPNRYSNGMEINTESPIWKCGQSECAFMFAKCFHWKVNNNHKKKFQHFFKHFYILTIENFHLCSSSSKKCLKQNF